MLRPTRTALGLLYMTFILATTVSCLLTPENGGGLVSFTDFFQALAGADHFGDLNEVVRGLSQGSGRTSDEAAHDAAGASSQAVAQMPQETVPVHRDSFNGLTQSGPTILADHAWVASSSSSTVQRSEPALPAANYGPIVFAAQRDAGTVEALEKFKIDKNMLGFRTPAHRNRFRFGPHGDGVKFVRYLDDRPDGLQPLKLFTEWLKPPALSIPIVHSDWVDLSMQPLVGINDARKGKVWYMVDGSSLRSKYAAYIDRGTFDKLAPGRVGIIFGSRTAIHLRYPLDPGARYIYRYSLVGTMPKEALRPELWAMPDLYKNFLGN